MKNKNLIIMYFIILSVVIISCEGNKIDKEDSFDIHLDELYSLLGKSVDEDCLLLEQSMKDDSLVVLKNKDQLLDVDIEFNKYYNYLVYIDSIANSNKRNIFFSNNKLNLEGEVFIKKSENLNKKIRLVVTDSLLLKRIDLLLDVGDIKNDEGLYLKYLDYFYNGVPYKSFCYLIKNRKRDLLLIKKELSTRQKN